MSDLRAEFISYPGTIHLIDNNLKLETAFAEMGEVTQFGFDTETRPSFKKGEVFKVALLQLATDEHAYLIRLHKISNFALIQKVLENENILKVGAAIREDLKQLQKTFAFSPKNFIELQTVAKEKGVLNMGLKGMTEEVLGQKLSKGPKLTNWEAYELTQLQQMYAATDAWIGLKLFNKITS